VQFAVDYSVVDDCVDLFANGTPIPPPREGDRIFRTIEITWSHDGTTTVLATYDADATNRPSATVTVPVSAHIGDATLSARSTDNALMTVRSP
jgi:hypothetical protein